MTVAAVPTKCRMPSVPDDQTLSQVERLLGELRLIELWDADYWRKCHPEGYERHAFVARRKRRAEILPQLVNLIPRGWTLRSRGPMDRLETEHNQNPENRRHRRLEFGTEVTIRSATESLPGRTLDISKTGMSALLPAELEVGEVVDLNIKTSIGVATGRAVVRNRNLFRHGFEFLRPLHGVARQEAADDCQGCGGSGFNLQAVDGGKGIAFMRTRCPDCGGTVKQVP